MEPQPLTGWKAIAIHLGVSEITAKRWREAGLPIHKPAGRSVLAFAAELNAWVRSRTLAAQRPDTNQSHSGTESPQPKPPRSAEADRAMQF